MKHVHEFRDPIHTFISVRTDEREVIDSRPFQRLRNIHQLALTYLVYPGATHRRFEHSLGVMEVATRIFDSVTQHSSISEASVREIIPDSDGLRYWRSVLRMAALCHDIGHLPFSHAAEKELLPEGYDHERITKDLIMSPEMQEIWSSMTPPLRAKDIVKLSVGQKKAKEFTFSTWESILAEIVIGDAFGADRIDYLLRDSYHAGVAYGRFDHNRLIGSLRILPQEHLGTDEPSLGLDYGGLESSEALMLARHFIWTQVYLHHIRRVYDIHLVDFLKSWLPSGKFSASCKDHLAVSDAEVLAALNSAAHDENSTSHQYARRITNREHLKRLYSLIRSDREGGVLQPGKKIYEAASEKFGGDNIRYDYMPAKAAEPDFPVRHYDGKIYSSLSLSEILKQLPPLEIDAVYCSREVLIAARRWKDSVKSLLLGLS